MDTDFLIELMPPHQVESIGKLLQSPVLSLPLPFLEYLYRYFGEAWDEPKTPEWRRFRGILKGYAVLNALEEEHEREADSDDLRPVRG